MRAHRNNIGEFEEVMLLIVAILHDDASGKKIISEITKRLNRKVSFGSSYTVLHRLVDKGFLETRFSPSTGVRGGKPKRMYNLTLTGWRILKRTKLQRDSLWEAVLQ